MGQANLFAYLVELGDVGEFIVKGGFVNVFDTQFRFVHHHDEGAAGYFEDFVNENRPNLT